MALTTIRTQAELRQRHARARHEIEADEYTRQIENGEDEVEDYRDIDRSAKLYLGYLVRNLRRGRYRHVRDAFWQYVAWKWMLGHADADTFRREDPRLTYIYLRDQINSGEWDRLTQQSIREMRGSR